MRIIMIAATLFLFLGTLVNEARCEFGQHTQLAVANAPKVVVDGRSLVFNDAQPGIQNGRVLVPMRAVFEELGSRVEWDQATSTVTATKAGAEIRLIIGRGAYKNGSPVHLDVSAQLVNGRVLVPLRFVSEAFGYSVDWDAEGCVAVITTVSGQTGSQKNKVPGQVNFTKPIMGNSRLPVLMFHSVNSLKPEGGLTPHWESSFRQLMERMHREGYMTITAKQAYDFNIKGWQLPAKSVWITFDDGWADNLTHAAPILAEYGYIATVFVETVKIGGYLRLTAEQISILRDRYSWDIQPHGHVGHSPVRIDSQGGIGSFYNNLKWLPELQRVETMEERHARVKADLEESISVLGQYNKSFCFAYPASEHGATEEIRADNDLLMDELGIMGVNVGKTGAEQIVPLNTTSRHKICRLGIQGDRSYDQIFNMHYFGLFVLFNDNSYLTKHPVYDPVNERFISGSVDGKITTFGKDWIMKLKPTPVKKPPSSPRPEPASNIVPTVLSNGDIWVGSVSGPSLYKLNLKDLSRPASREIPLDFKPYNVVSDGEKIYAFDTDGVVRRIETSTGAVSTYCTLPGGTSVSYSGSVLAEGVLYAYDLKQNQILKYDFTNKKLIKYITWKPRDYQLQPWLVLDGKSILTFCNKNWRHVVLEYE